MNDFISIELFPALDKHNALDYENPNKMSITTFLYGIPPPPRYFSNFTVGYHKIVTR